MEKVLVSACLMGQKVRYDGSDVKEESDAFQQLLSMYDVVSFCPEVAGGLPIPRVPAEIVGGTSSDVLAGKAKVLSKDGVDVTDAFIYGAQKTLQLCLEQGITRAFLTEKSPSCGSSQVYNGAFSGTKIIGQGITTALLRQNGITVHNQHQVNI